MTRISRHRLSQKTTQSLQTQFVTLLAAANEKQMAEIFETLFTHTEQIMFIKRLAMIILLKEGYSTYAISKYLKVSDSTVRDFKQKYNQNYFLVIERMIRKKTFDKKKFWDTIELLLRAGMPPRGRGRWKWLYEQT